MSSTEMDQGIIDITPATESPKTEKQVQVECDNSESIVILEIDQNIIEINPTNISSESEQKVQVKSVVSSERDQEVTEETAPDSILSESEQVNYQDSDDDECVIISDFDDDDNNSDPRPRSVMPMPIPIFVEPEENNQGDFQLYNTEYENDNMEVDGCVSNSVSDRSSVKESIVISDDDPDSPEPPKTLKSILKRKISPKYSEYEYRKSMKPGPKCKTRYTMPSILKRRLKIPSNTDDIEYSRKTMKPGPKSKTRNIRTVHELIAEARTAGPSFTRLLTLDSEDENTSTEEESEEEYYESSESEIEEPLSPDFKISEEYYEMLKIKCDLRNKARIMARNMPIDSDVISLNTTDEESNSDEVINPNIEDLENNVIDVDELEDIILETEENDKNYDDDLENNVIDVDEIEDIILKTEENDKNNDDDLENNVIDDDKVEDKILKTEENDKNNDDDLENNVIDDEKVEDKILKTEENDKIDELDNAMNPNMKDLKNNGDDLKNNEIDDDNVEDKLLNTEENDKIVVFNNVINPNIEDLKNNDNIVDEDKALNNYEINGKKLSKVEELESNTIIPNEEHNNTSVQ